MTDAEGTRPTVLLLGDSIRLGYQPVVAAQLAGIATVRGPGDNGRETAYTLAHLDAWLAEAQADASVTVVHCNCGLHDLKREGGATDTVVPLARYADNLAAIIARVRARTDAALIVATTTPIHEARHAARGLDFARVASDVPAYNDALRTVCARLAVPVNDLYGVVTEGGGDALLLADGTHYTEVGYAALGTAVAQSVRPYLPPT